MKKLEPSFFYLFGLLAIVVAPWLIQGMARGCDIAAGEAGKAYLSCAEFWLERYQTLVVGIASVGIAVVAIYYVVRQLEAMTQQSALATKALEVTNAQQAMEYNRAASKALVILRGFGGQLAQLMIEISDIERLPRTERAKVITSSSIVREFGQALVRVAIDVPPAFRAGDVQLFDEIQLKAGKLTAWVALKAAQAHHINNPETLLVLDPPNSIAQCYECCLDCSRNIQLLADRLKERL